MKNKECLVVEGLGISNLAIKGLGRILVLKIEARTDLALVSLHFDLQKDDTFIFDHTCAFQLLICDLIDCAEFVFRTLDEDQSLVCYKCLNIKNTELKI